MRRIDTEAGTLVGIVDRVAQAVVWHLECPECAELITLSEEAFRGQAAAVCGSCGWKTMPVGTLEQSGPHGIYVYFDFADGAFGSSISHVEQGGLQRGMRL